MMHPIIPVHVLQDALLEPVLNDCPQSIKALAATIERTQEFQKKKPAKLDDPRPGEPDIFVFDAERGEELPGKLVWNEGSSKPVPVEDEQVVRALNNADMYRRFLGRVNRNSLDNKGVNLRAVVRYGDKMVNAFCTDNGGEPIMVYGEGDGVAFLDFTHDPFISFHEGRHAVSGEDNGLIYLGMPGALNEHLSDVDAVAGMHWHHGTSLVEASRLKDSWVIGAPVIGQSLKAEGWRGIRDMAEAKAYPKDPQPKHMSRIYVGIEDNGGVHINSGIPNHVFERFCMFASDKGVKYSFEEPYKIWYAVGDALGTFSHFRDFREQLMHICEEMYPELISCMKEALKAVGL